MDIPEINERQHNTLKLICTTGAYSQIVPDVERDSLQNFQTYSRGAQDTEELMNLGFIEEITDNCSDVLDRIFLANGRRFRVFALTPLGRVMFNEAENRMVQ